MDGQTDHYKINTYDSVKMLKSIMFELFHLGTFHAYGAIFYAKQEDLFQTAYNLLQFLWIVLILAYLVSVSEDCNSSVQDQQQVDSLFSILHCH